MIQSSRDTSSTSVAPPSSRRRRRDGGRSSPSSSRSGRSRSSISIHHRSPQSSLESIPEDVCQEFFSDDYECSSLHLVNDHPAAGAPAAVLLAKEPEPRLEEEAQQGPINYDAYTLVNQERARHQLPALRHNVELDRLAHRHCRRMAELRTVFHSVQSIEELVTLLSATQHAAESIQRGDHLLQMHHETVVMQRQSINYHNLVSAVFTELGVATCLGRDGKLYHCLLFRN